MTILDPLQRVTDLRLIHLLLGLRHLRLKVSTPSSGYQRQNDHEPLDLMINNLTLTKTGQQTIKDATSKEGVRKC